MIADSEILAGRRAFTEKILPRFREIFLSPSNAKGPPERDPAKEAGLMVLLEHIAVITSNCSGKEFKDGTYRLLSFFEYCSSSLEILPIIHLAIESPMHSIVDASLRSLPIILPVLDFSTIKNELFPVVATVFSKTSSLGIKVRGLEAFVILCGGSSDAASNDGLDGIINANAKKSSSSALDKYTMQEKIIPLIRAIKTKEPAVAMAALNVLRVVGGIADTDFVAMDILPILWSMSLGPLLDLKQFQSFMDLIKSLSSRVETEQTKKLQELSGTNGSRAKGNDDFMSFGATNAFSNGGADNGEIDFERLVKGNAADSGSSNPLDAGWDAAPSTANVLPQMNVSNQPKPASFAWSTPSPTTPSHPNMGALKPQQPISRTITPDLSRFDALSPTTTQFSQPLQPQPFQPPAQSIYNASSHMGNYNSTPLQAPPQPKPQHFQSFQSQPATVNWGTATANPWANTQTSNQLGNLGNSMGSMSMNQQRPVMNSQPSYVPSFHALRDHCSTVISDQILTVLRFSLPPPPGAPSNSFEAAQSSSAFGMPSQPKPPNQKSGLDAYESLI
jgi:SCY1-like protein 2